MNDQKKTLLKALPTIHVEAMRKAMEEAKVFTIVKTENTVTATHKERGEVFRALKSPNGLWLIRHDADLFV